LDSIKNGEHVLISGHHAQLDCSSAKKKTEKTAKGGFVTLAQRSPNLLEKNVNYTREKDGCHAFSHRLALVGDNMEMLFAQLRR
jgi:hypothetical protein